MWLPGKTRVIPESLTIKRCASLRLPLYRWILKKLGDDLTEADIDDMIADVDTDGSGWVDFEGNWFTAK